MRRGMERPIAAVVMAVLGLGSPGCKRAPAPAAPKAATVDWAVDPAHLGGLGPEFSAPDFGYQPPLGYELVLNRSAGAARGYAWMSPARADGTRAGTTIAIVYLGPSRMKRPSLDEAMGTALQWSTTALRDVGAAPEERGTVDGVPFVRTRFHGTEPRTQRTVWGVIYVTVDDQRVFQLSASDAITPPGGDVLLGESSLRTFRLRKLRTRLADPQRERAVQAAYRRGLALRQRGDLARAEAAYRHAIRLDPSYPSPHNNLGTVLLDQGRVEAAVAEYRKTLALDPNHPLAHGNLGNALRQLGRYDEALPELRRAVALGPGRSDHHNNLGVCLKKMGQVSEATIYYREAIRLDPRNARAHANLADALVALRLTEESLPEYRRAIELDPRYLAAITDYGIALVYLLRRREALEQFRRAQAIQPGYRPAREWEAWVLRTLRRAAPRR